MDRPVGNKPEAKYVASTSVDYGSRIYCDLSLPEGYRVGLPQQKMTVDLSYIGFKLVRSNHQILSRHSIRITNEGTMQDLARLTSDLIHIRIYAGRSQDILHCLH